MHLVYTYPKLTRIENACCLILHFSPAQYSTSFKQDWTQILTSKPCLLYLFENIHSHDMTNTWVVLEFSPFLTYFSPFFLTFFHLYSKLYSFHFHLLLFFFIFHTAWIWIWMTKRRGATSEKVNHNTGEKNRASRFANYPQKALQIKKILPPKTKNRV